MGNKKTTETERMADLYETRAVLSRAKLTQSTLTDIHIPTQFLCLAVLRCVNTGESFRS